MATTDLRTGDLRSTLVGLTLPMLVGMVFHSLPGVADAYFVAPLGTAELAALGFTIPMVTLVSLVQIGFGIGVTVIVANAVGRGDAEHCRRVALDATILSLLFTLALVLFGLLLRPYLFTAMGAAPGIVPLASRYATIYFLCAVVPQGFVLTGTALLRGAGETRSSAFILMAVAVLNIAIDPLLIFGVGPLPRMGLAGGAAAMAAAYVVVSLPTLAVLSRRRLLNAPWPGIARLRQTWQVLSKTSVPAAFANSLEPIGALVVTSFVGAHGPVAVAAFGVVSRIERVLMIVPRGMGGALGPFAAQNWGAGQRERARAGHQLAGRYAIYWGTGALVAFGVLAGPLGRIFGSDARVAEMTTLGLRILPLGYAAMGYVTLTVSYFSATGKARLGALLGFLRALGLIAPLAAAGSSYGGMLGLLAGCAAAQVVAMLLALRMLRAGEPVDEFALEAQP